MKTHYYYKDRLFIEASPTLNDFLDIGAGSRFDEYGKYSGITIFGELGYSADDQPITDVNGTKWYRWTIISNKDTHVINDTLIVYISRFLGKRYV